MHSYCDSRSVLINIDEHVVLSSVGAMLTEQTLPGDVT